MFNLIFHLSNKKISGIFFIVISFSSAISAVEGQIPTEPVNIQSPNVSNLGLFQEMPVSFYTGLPQIEIPLYNIKEKSINVPISLSYHASGFRPEAHPGWVGLGWNLSCGGVISRTIKDIPDDYNNSNYYLGKESGFYFNYQKLDVSNWDQLSYMKTIAQTDEMLKDTEPDEFAFSFPGGNGKFFLDHTGNWKAQCDKPVKIIFSNQFLEVPFAAPYGTRMYTYGNTKSFSGFTIIDENGVQYIYGGNTDAIEYSIGFFTQDLEEWFAESWYLTKIIDVDGNEISFNYEKDNFINQMYISIYNNIQTRTVNSGGFLNPQPSCSSWDYRSIYASYSGKLISPSYLRSIDGTSARINFFRSTSTELRYDQITYDYQYSMWMQRPYTTIEFLPILSGNHDYYPQCLDKLKWNKLDNIEINNNGKTIKSYEFNYTNNNTNRLTLLSLKEKGANGKEMPPYQFTYDNSKPLPNYLANKTDHWGFYNGTYADISDMNNYMNTYFGYREPNADYLVAGTLNKIKYPTGGVTKFLFEPHQYNKRLKFVRSEGIDPTFNQKTLAGGLRIKKISYYEDESLPVSHEKEYFYVLGYNNNENVNNLPSSGVLGGQIKYYFDDYRSEAFNDNGIVYSKSIFSSQSVLPVSYNSHGSHIGYSEVIEKNSDGGYRKFMYSNFDNGHIDEAGVSIQISRTAYEPYSSLDVERGMLLKEETYNLNNILVNKQETDYIPLNKNNEYVRALSARYFIVCPNTAVSCAEGIAYKLYTYSYLPSVIIETSYDQNGNNPSVQTTSFTYDEDTKLVKTEQHQNSNNNVIQTNYKYPGDYNIQGAITNLEALAIKNLQEKNIVAPVIEKYVKKGVQGGSNLKTVHAEYYSYKPSPNKLESVSILGLAQSVNDYYPTTINANATVKDFRYEKLISYNGYDLSGNIIQYKKVDGTPVSYLWGYDKTYPIAEVKNARNDIITTSKSITKNGTINLSSNYGTLDFTTQNGGNLKLLAYANPTFFLKVNYSLHGPVNFSGSLCVARTLNTTCYYPTDVTLNIPPGSYHLTLSVMEGTGEVLYSYPYLSEETVITKEFFHTSFEETDGNSTSGDAVTGKYSRTGGYATTLPNLTAGDYILSYWKKQGVEWEYNESTVSVSGTSYQLNLTGQVDEIRFYPTDALMTTYTYEPLIGMTSQCDENNHITYYEYDDFGRLSVIKDGDGNVLKKYCYNYAGQIEDCGFEPAVIYARLTYENRTYTSLSTNADIVVRFYQDEARTVPYSVNNMEIKYIEDSPCADLEEPPGPGDSFITIGNGFYTVLRSQAIISFISDQDCEMVYDPPECQGCEGEWSEICEDEFCNIDYMLVNSNGYIIIP